MINLNTSTMHKVFKSRRNMMGIIHMESLKTMCPPGYVGSKSTQDIGIYKLDLHLHIRYTSTPHKTPKSCRSKMNIRHICNHCLVITKMALWQLKHLGTCCVMYSEVLHCIQKPVSKVLLYEYMQGLF